MALLDIEKDFDAAYTDAYSHWQPFLEKADNDFKFFLGNQWTDKELAYLRSQRRAILTFNKIKRLIKMVEGYQRKHRLAMMAGPAEGSDAETAQIFSALLMQVMSKDGFSVMSDAFAGMLKTGLNLVRIYVDYDEDPLSGDVKLQRIPYNRCILDPGITKRDLSDCQYLIVRSFSSEDQIRALLPEKAGKDIDQAMKAPRKSLYDGKFSYGLPPAGVYPNSTKYQDLHAYDEFWVRKYKKKTFILNPQTGQQQEFQGSKKDLKETIQRYPGLTSFDKRVPVAVQNIMIDGNFITDYEDPYGVGDYPFVPLFCYFDPEAVDSDYRVQGLVRSMVDPQREINRRRVKMLDILDSQTASGWKAKAGAVADPGELFKTGQGQVVTIKEDYELTDVERLNPPVIPESMIAVTGQIDNDLMEISGVNNEMLGDTESAGVEVAAMLAKQRQAAGLTTMQDIFDNYRFSKEMVGKKMIQAMQSNYLPVKVMRLLSVQPTQEFYKKDFGKYDVVVQEGVLTDTQEEALFTKMLLLQQVGIDIPQEFLLSVAPIPGKEKLIQMIQQRDKAAAEAQQNQQTILDRSVEAETARRLAEVEKSKAKAEELRSQARENESDALLNRAKMATEISEMQRKGKIEMAKLIAELTNLTGKGSNGNTDKKD